MSKKPKYERREPPRAARGESPASTLMRMLSRPGIGSTAFIADQYDHEVQGTSVTKPLHGRGRVNSDAGVLQPLPASKKGIVLSHGYAPWYSDVDTYAMAAASIDLAVRNAICAGASLEYLAILDNFCWSSSNTPERLYELKRAAKACYDLAVAYGTPFISGKDSMFNDFRGFTAKDEPIHIAAPPTLLISAIGVVPDVSRSVSLDFKLPGDSVYLIGETNAELGASEYFSMLGYVGNRVPHVDAKKNLKAYRAFSRAIEQGIVASALGVGRGGLGVALARSTIGGELGVVLDLRKLPGDARKADEILFSESQGRILASVASRQREVFERVMQGIPLTRIGEVMEKPRVAMKLPRSDLGMSLGDLARAYRKPFQNW